MRVHGNGIMVVEGGETVTMSQAVPIAESDERSAARSPSTCFVCGQDNPQGLHLLFEREESGKLAATWTPRADWEGYHGIIHGGIVSTVLDEAMSKAVAASGAQAFTAEIRVRFRHHVTTGDVFEIRGWVVKRNKRLIEAEAELTTPNGTEHAHAWASFLALPERQG